MVKEYLKLFVSSIFAGFIMALAGFELVVMKANNLFVLGCFLQGFGLLIILFFGLKFFNCHLCNVFSKENRFRNIINLLIILIINVFTIVGCGYLFRLITGFNESFNDAAINFVNWRLIEINEFSGRPWYLALLGAIICGIITFVGSYIYKNVKHPFIKLFAVLFAVGLFDICLFENFMTNVLYVSYANMFNLSTILDLILVLFGNVIGIYLTYFAISFIKKNK